MFASTKRKIFKNWISFSKKNLKKWKNILNRLRMATGFLLGTHTPLFHSGKQILPKVGRQTHGLTWKFID